MEEVKFRHHNLIGYQIDTSEKVGLDISLHNLLVNTKIDYSIVAFTI